MYLSGVRTWCRHAMAERRFCFEATSTANWPYSWWRTVVKPVIGSCHAKKENSFSDECQKVERIVICWHPVNLNRFRPWALSWHRSAIFGEYHTLRALDSRRLNILPEPRFHSLSGHNAACGWAKNVSRSCAVTELCHGHRQPAENWRLSCPSVWSNKKKSMEMIEI